MVHELECARSRGWVDGEAFLDEVNAQLAELVLLGKWRVLGGDADVVHDGPSRTPE